MHIQSSNQLDFLGMNIVLKDWGGIMSNSNGLYFVESLKGTNRNKRGYVNCEHVYVNMVVNAADVLGSKAEKQLKSLIIW